MEYEFLLSALNEYGKGPPAVYRLNISQIAPTGVPGDVQVRAVNRTHVQVSWTPLYASESGGGQVSYRVRVRLVQSGDCLLSSVGGSAGPTQTASSIQKEIVDQSTTYFADFPKQEPTCVAVEAFNKVGTAPYSNFAYFIFTGIGTLF